MVRPKLKKKIVSFVSFHVALSYQKRMPIEAATAYAAAPMDPMRRSLSALDIMVCSNFLSMASRSSRTPLLPALLLDLLDPFEFCLLPTTWLLFSCLRLMWFLTTRRTMPVT